MAKEVKILKSFRDEVLLKNAVGMAFMKSYYKISPPAADYIAKHDNLRMLVRWGLFPIVGMSWITLTLGLGPTAFLFVLLLSLVVTILVLIKRRANLKFTNPQR